MEEYIIKKGTIDEVVHLSQKIPSFEQPYKAFEYKMRLSNANHLILIAYANTKPIGFKVGYERDKDGSFYTWMGGVLNDYRQKGVAKRLAKSQERWAKQNGYNKIKLTTRNAHQAMLIFAISSGFKIVGIEERSNIEEYRVILEKNI